MSARHSWETNEEPQAARVHAWERPEGSESGDSDLDSSDRDPATDPGAAADMFLEKLLGEYMHSVISAQTFCILCHWAWKAGMPGRAAAYAYPPGRESGHYQRHLTKQLGLGLKRKKEYRLPIVGHRLHDADRTQFALPVKPGHELLNEELQTNPSVRLRLREAIEGGELAPCYWEHPVVKASNIDVLPAGIYMDAVPYTNSDSVVAVWLINLITGARHVMAVLRKRVACRCGCGGWCTYYPLMHWLRWVIECLAQGKYACARHDGTAWTTHDRKWRAGRQGAPLVMKTAVIQIRADWSEFCERLGFPTWKSTIRPCFFCNGCGPDMYSAEGASMVGSSWELNSSFANYDNACSRCEIKVEITAALRDMIFPHLRYDKRPDGVRGLALMQAFPDLGLQVDDRLEPTEAMPDVAQFEHLSAFPVTVVFWRRSRESLCTRRCPLWDERLGITPDKVLAIDLLHTMYLGCLQEWAKCAAWALLKANYWGALGSDREKFQINVLSLRTHLKQWYKKWAAAKPDQPLTQLADLRPKMLGTSQSPKLAMKGLETYGFALFLEDVLRGCVAADEHVVPFARPLLRSGQCLLRYISVLKENGKVLPARAAQD